MTKYYLKLMTKYINLPALITYRSSHLMILLKNGFILVFNLSRIVFYEFLTRSKQTERKYSVSLFCTLYLHNHSVAFDEITAKILERFWFRLISVSCKANHLSTNFCDYVTHSRVLLMTKKYLIFESSCFSIRYIRQDDE